MDPLVVELAVAEGHVHRVVGFELERALGRPPRATIDVRMLDYVEPRVLLGQSATLRFGHGQTEHTIAGIVTSAAAVATPTNAPDKQTRLRLEVVSVLGLLEQSVTSRIFQELSVPDIVKQVLVDHGIDESKQKWRLGGSYPPRTYCVQYGESALDFCHRLLEKEGIFYSLRGSDDGEQIVFEDDSAACDPLEGEARVPYVTSSGQHAAESHVRSITDIHKVTSGKVVLRDYDYQRPDLDLTAEAEGESDAELELYDYPGGYIEPDEGKRYARVKLEAECAARRTLEVRGNCARLAEGRRMTLADAPRGLDGDYVVTRATHRYRATDGSGAWWRVNPEERSEPSFDVTAELVPVSVPYRVAATTPRPIIDGPQTAIVVAPEGAEPEEIHTDELGRCKVKFHWDLGEALDDKASTWIRTQQLATSGSMILPRVDWEVIVEFQQGDPDRPIITGRMFNGRYKPPYELPAGKTRSSIGGASSPGGAGKNEIRFEDAAGSEEVSVKAQKNQKIATGNNKTKSTGNNETQSVASNRTLIVGANQTIRVTSGYQNTVAGAQTVMVAGSRDVGVNAVLGLSAPSMAGAVGGNQFEMDGNPLAGLIDLASEKAIEAAKEKAADAMKQLDAAVKDKVDKVMGPIDKLQDTLGKVEKGFDAAKNGDLSGAADAAREAAGLPTPEKFASDLKDKAMGKAKEKLNEVPGAGFGQEAAKEAGLIGGEEKKATKGGAPPADEGGGDVATKSKGGGNGSGETGSNGSPVDGALDTARQVQKEGISAATGLDEMVNKGIEDAVEGAAGGLKDALGVGQSGKNFPGPPGGVSGNAAADSACGPGHSVHQVGAAYSETIGALRATIAAGKINTNASGARTQSIGAARIELVNGVRAEACSSKKETAVGLVVIASGAEGEKIGGSKSTSVGGAILAKVGSDAKLASGGPASFIGAFQKVTASGKISFNCGASSVVIDGSGITIKSPSVSFVAASMKLTKTVAQGPGGGAGGGGGAGPGGASGGGGGGPGAGQGGSGGGGGGGGSSGGTGQDPGKEDKRAGGADQNKKWPPHGSTKGQPPPSDDRRKLAGEKNKDPDDGLNDERRKAREECLQHYYDNNKKVKDYDRGPDGRPIKGPDGKPIEKFRDPTAKEAESHKNDFDTDKPVHYKTPDDKLPGGKPEVTGVNGSYDNKGAGDEVPDGHAWGDPSDKQPEE